MSQIKIAIENGCKMASGKSGLCIRRAITARPAMAASQPTRPTTEPVNIAIVGTRYKIAKKTIAPIEPPSDPKAVHNDLVYPAESSLQLSYIRHVAMVVPSMTVP